MDRRAESAVLCYCPAQQFKLGGHVDAATRGDWNDWRRSTRASRRCANSAGLRVDHRLHESEQAACDAVDRFGRGNWLRRLCRWTIRFGSRERSLRQGPDRVDRHAASRLSRRLRLRAPHQPQHRSIRRRCNPFRRRHYAGDVDAACPHLDFLFRLSLGSQSIARCGSS